MDESTEEERTSYLAAPTQPVLVSTLPALVAVLRDARLGRGLSQAAVANRLGVNHSAVSNWERGTSKPGPGLLIGWARLVGVPLWAIPEEQG